VRELSFLKKSNSNNEKSERGRDIEGVNTIPMHLIIESKKRGIYDTTTNNRPRTMEQSLLFE
jgi:hypothetical protein